jgi:hypothetical protein
MDKALSVLISVGIIIFGAWVVAATIATGWPLVRTLMALFPILTGFISSMIPTCGAGLGRDSLESGACGTPHPPSPARCE